MSACTDVPRFAPPGKRDRRDRHEEQSRENRYRPDDVVRSWQQRVVGILGRILILVRALRNQALPVVNFAAMRGPHDRDGQLRVGHVIDRSARATREPSSDALASR